MASHLPTFIQILERSIVLHSGQDDLGSSGDPTGKSGDPLACCLIKLMVEKEDSALNQKNEPKPSKAFRTIKLS